MVAAAPSAESQGILYLGKDLVAFSDVSSRVNE